MLYYPENCNWGWSQFVRFNGETSVTTMVTSGVPQGSVLGPILFIEYSAEVIGLVEQPSFNVHAFANDLYAAQHDAALLAKQMSTCIESVKAWMSSNRLCFNPSKTELIWLGSSRRLHHCSGTGMRVSDVDLQPIDCVRNLGVLIDSGMTLTRHVNYISGVCFFQLRQLRIIRRSLTADVAHALVCALIHTRIDYYNGLLVSCLRYPTDKLQAVLRVAARLVLQLPYRSSVSEVMHRQLHWLDVEERVNYKIGLLVYKCLHGLAPSYLSDQCISASSFAGCANMHSSLRLDWQLYVPRTKTKTLGPRGFYYASSAVWNSLPADLRDPRLSLHSFRTKLKSHFFTVD